MGMNFEQFMAMQRRVEREQLQKKGKPDIFSDYDEWQQTKVDGYRRPPVSGGIFFQQCGGGKRVLRKKAV